MIGSGHHKAVVLAFERGYRVDVEGRVIAPSGKVRAINFKRKRGAGAVYGRVSIKTNDGYRSFEVHKLVAYQKFRDAAFVEGIHVRHLNGDSTDNRSANIAIGTVSDNAFDKTPEVRRSMALHAAAAKRKLTATDVRALVEMRRNGASGKACAEAFGVRASTVCEVMRGKLYSELTGIPFTPRKKEAA